MPSNLTTQALSPALAGILAAKTKTTPSDIQIVCRDYLERCFYICLPRADDKRQTREIIRDAYAKDVGCSTDFVFLDAFADSEGKFWVIGRRVSTSGRPQSL